MRIIPKVSNNDEFESTNANALRTKTLKKLDIKYLPDDVTISTMTLVCGIDTKFNCENIARYISLSPNGILSVSYGKNGDTRTNRSIIKKKTSSGKKKKQKKCFYNQVSMYIDVSTKKKKPVNIKLFCDGAIQMTGCKTIDHSIEVLTKVLFELKKTKAIVDAKTRTIVEKPFVTNPEKLNIKDVSNLRIAMINSGFEIEFKIDRSKLHNLLLENNYECLFDPAKHACVNIKYDHPDKTISVFVFEKGSIIITGAQNCLQIYSAYDFINKYLLKNHHHIKKNDMLTNSNIIKYLDPTDVIDTNMSSSDESD